MEINDEVIEEVPTKKTSFRVKLKPAGIRIRRPSKRWAVQGKILINQNPIQLGRRNAFPPDLKISKTQIIIWQQNETDDFLYAVRKGQNPTCIMRGQRLIVMDRNKEYILHNEDCISLMLGEYWHKVTAKENTPGLNYLFYSNKLPSSPGGDFIDSIHEHWWNQYQILEDHHSYIQWLFPLFEGKGMNFQSKKLKKDEAHLMRQDLEIAKRFIKSYKMMLGFYGMKLDDDVTGKIARADNWKERYENMNKYTHNNRRITRIITSMGHLGFTRWKKPLVDFLASEIQKNESILFNLKKALVEFWKPALDVHSDEFREKTLEEESDREDSIYFKSLVK